MEARDRKAEEAKEKARREEEKRKGREERARTQGGAVVVATGDLSMTVKKFDKPEKPIMLKLSAKKVAEGAAANAKADEREARDLAEAGVEGHVATESYTTASGRTTTRRRRRS